MSTVLAIPDLHMPFQHRDAFEFLAQVKRKYRPDIIINLGDEVDHHALSDHDHDVDGHSAGDEFQMALEEMSHLYAMFPSCGVAVSNHGLRPFRRAYRYGLPKAFLRDYHEFMQAPPGWRWEDSFTVDGVVYEHGMGMSGPGGALKAALANMASTVIGHLHSWAGIAFSANQKCLVWGMNAGCLLDRDRYAFAYGRIHKSKPILGCGIIRDAVPTYIPMILNRSGRWTGGGL